MAILLLLLALLGENRLFVGRVELVGPVSEVRFDCGAAGEVRLRADLVEGERRGVEIPFPVRSPLGIDALDDVPAPRVVEPARGVRFAGWSEAQPAARFAVLPLGLTSRTRPPLARGGAGGAGGAGVGLAIALATGLGVLALRRRAGLALCVGLAGGFFAAVVPGLFRGATGTRAGESVIEVEAGVERGLLVRSGTRVELGSAVHIESEPGDALLVFDLRLAPGGASGSAAVRGEARLLSMEEWNLAGVWLEDAPAPRSLERAWTREPDGTFVARGRWEQGRALPDPVPGAPPPPGWLVAGLPPGRGVLIGESPPGEGPARWIRVVGF